MDGNTLWHGYVNMTDGAFSGWTLLSGSTPSAPTLTQNGAALYLVVRGQNNLIYNRLYNDSLHTWGDWFALPSGATCDSPAAALLKDQLHVVVRGMDGYSLWHGIMNASTMAFSGWERLSGATQSAPALVASKTRNRNEVYLVVRGMDNIIYRNTFGSYGFWTGWIATPAGATPDGVGAMVMCDSLHVAVRGMDGYSLWHGVVDLATDNFTNWALLSGSTPSKPTLTS
jgi:hypothetical protein